MFHYYFCEGGKRMTANKLKHQAKLQEWKELVRECRSSGVPVEHWCKERGVSKHTYYRWEREILDIAAQHITSIAPKEEVTTFAEVPAPQQPYRNGSGCSATLRVGTVSIDIYEGTSAELLRTMLTVIQSC